MKRQMRFLFFVLLLVLLPQSAFAAGDGKLLEIKERMFATQCDDIYINPNKYEGRRVKLEGFCLIEKNPDTGKEMYGVFRNSPGCCGNDGLSGFEFTYGGKKPKKNDWIEVTGKLVLEKDSLYSVIIIQAESVVVKKQRGASFVRN